MRFLRFALIALFMAACGASENKVRARASSDLQCHASQLERTEIKRDHTHRVSGCGKQGIYVLHDGQAIFDAPSSSAAGAGSAAPEAGRTEPTPSVPGTPAAK